MARIIRGVNQVALVLSKDEYLYILASVGRSSDTVVNTYCEETNTPSPTKRINGFVLYETLKANYEDKR